MAGFKTHLTASSLLGAGYGSAAFVLFDVPLPTCLLAGGLCSVSGMLPDVDSNSGVPLRESLAFGSAVVPMMMIDRFVKFGMSSEMIVLSGAAVYLIVRFVLGEWLRRYTVHRGMFHSLPAAVIFGQLAFLLASGDVSLRWYKAGAVVIGYLCHLGLDELYSIEWHRGRLRLKKSFGTALKVFSHSWWANISAYAKLAILTWVVLEEPGWMEHFRISAPAPTARQTFSDVAERLVGDNPLPTGEQAGDRGDEKPNSVGIQFGREDPVFR